MSWAAVRLTEARQVLELLGHDQDEWPDGAAGNWPGDWPDASSDVESYYRELQERNRLTEALKYLGQALPRAEVVRWAGAQLDADSNQIELKRSARVALDAALRWIGEPSDQHRQAAYAAAEKCRRFGPEKFLAMAVFYSGGSIAGNRSGVIQPPATACADCATSAIEQASYRAANSAAYLAAALEQGEQLAQRGLKALAT